MNATMRTPAKVNLCLLVGPRDEAGYHEIFTVFAPIDLYDELEFSLEARAASGTPGELQVDCVTAPGEANLAALALRSLERHTGWALSGRVSIRKHIPVGAGLGGGSSDAAAALIVGSQVLTQAGGPMLERDELLGIARKLGADVPFFLDPAPAIGRGIGDILQRIDLPPLWLVLVTFDRMLSTARAYRTLDAMRLPVSKSFFDHRAVQAETRWRQVKDAAYVARLLENDLEQASFDLLPLLAGDRDLLLREGALGALMSGSGPTLFGLCGSGARAYDVARRLVGRGMRAQVVTVTSTATGPA